MSDQRGGVVLKTGNIGNLNCLRQQLMMPGEKIDTRITGKVMVESLRERETLRLNAHLAVFLTPVRWLDANWANFLKEGPDSSSTPATAGFADLASIGLGAEAASVQIPTFFNKSALKVFNEWYKWPEDADVGSWGVSGPKAVPLQHTWNRCRYTIDPDDTADYRVSAPTGVGAASLDVRDLAETQAKFRAGMERDVLSYNRYMELVREMFNADGSREVDQVPMMIDQTELGVRPREMAATDTAGLGDWQSIYDFGVDHSIDGIVAPEHCVLTYMMLLRFAPVIEGRNPLAVEDLSWEDYVGDPEILRNKKPVDVRIKDVVTSTSTTSLGYLPAMWRWTQPWDCVGKVIDDANSFPMMNSPTSKTNAKDATRIKDAFRSQAYEDFIIDLEFDERSHNLHGASLESYFSGMTGAGSDAAIPKQGKML